MLTTLAVGFLMAVRLAGAHLESAEHSLDQGQQASTQGTSECAEGAPEAADWIFCDDFEAGEPEVAQGRYFEISGDEGDFVRLPNVGLDGSHGMRVRWQAEEVSAGGLKVGFGRVPNAYIGRAGIRPDEDFREIFYRMYLRMQPGWRGNPAKLSRATVFTSASDWRQAMIAHLWGAGPSQLLIDPASCVDDAGRVRCTTYNDFDNLDWLGSQRGETPIFATESADRWWCVEAYVRLNDPGEANGVQAFWIDDHLEARRENLDFVGTYTDYGLNAVFFENYWNEGSPVEQERYFDNLVIATQRIGCLSPGTVVATGYLPALTGGR